MLAFSAGIINAIAFMGFSHQAATHVTGLFSHLSIALSRLDFTQARLVAFIILSFFTGAVLSGAVLRDAHLKMGRRYGAALGLECLFLLLSTYGFHRGSAWGEYFASMAAGLQNAMVSTYSGAIVRTTHLTGVLTDLGVLVGHGLRGLAVDFRRVRLLAILILSFTAGGFWGALLYSQSGYNAMLVPAGIVGLSAVIYSTVLNRPEASGEPQKT